MVYNIGKIRQDKTRYTWKYIFNVYIVGFFITYIMVHNILNIIGIENKLISFVCCSFIIGIIGNLSLFLKINVFNILLYTINRLLISIGFYTISFLFSFVLASYLKETYSLKSYIVYLIMFVTMFVISFLFCATKKKRKKIADKEELALNIYDEWTSTIELLKLEKERKNRIFLVSIIRNIIKKDVDDEVFLIDDKMKLEFINECKDLLEENILK